MSPTSAAKAAAAPPQYRSGEALRHPKARLLQTAVSFWEQSTGPLHQSTTAQNCQTILSFRALSPLATAHRSLSH